MAALYSAHCAGQKGGQFSSFTLQGRDRIPLQPGEPLPTPLFLPDLTPEASQTLRPWSSPMATRLQLPGLGWEPTEAFTEQVFQVQGGCHAS